MCCSGASGRLPSSDQGEYGYSGAFASAGLKEAGDGGFGFVQPGGRRLSGETCLRVVAGVVAFVLEIAEKVGEDLGAG